MTQETKKRKSGEQTNVKMFCARIPIALHTKFRTHAIKTGKTFAALTAEAFTEKLDREKKGAAA